MPHSTRKRTKLFIALLALVYIGVCVLSIEIVVGLYREQLQAQAREDVRQQLAISRSRLEAALYRNTYIADSLATIITLDPSAVENNWEEIAAKLFESSSHIVSVSVAPNDIITQTYPVQGNESVVGLDFRTLPKQMRGVAEARKREAVYLAGPVDLIQGGVGLIARFPIFSDYPKNLDYWGSVSVVMDFERVIAQSTLKDIEGANIALRRQEFGTYSMIFGMPEVFETPDTTVSVHTPSGNWQLAAQYRINLTPGARASAIWIRSMGGTITGLVLLTALLSYRAYHHNRRVSLQDELTGLPNRRLIMNDLERLMAKPAGRVRFTLILIDLNHFKTVNDRYGHEAGDQLLCHVSRRLQLAVRSSDLVARLGGDEFLLLLHRVADKERIKIILSNVIASVEEHPMQWQAEKIWPSMSAGYAVYRGQPVNLKELMAMADEKMYRAKRAR